MRTLLLLWLLVCSSILTFSQSEKRESIDSLNLDTERIEISEELPVLRDSISHFIKIVRAEIRKSPPSRKEVLEKSLKELTDLRSSINSDIKEILQDKCNTSFYFLHFVTNLIYDDQLGRRGMTAVVLHY